MAKLTPKARKALPASDFAGPNRSYPVQDKSHAKLAKSGASRAEHVGNISKATEKAIDRKADKVLSKGGHHSIKNPESHLGKLKHA
ncbi:MAG: hypothetical protein LAP38_03295 [Acidobacteriia bacterium]|nr:hypothetical protein [Terriglobia bacterium]